MNQTVEFEDRVSATVDDRQIVKADCDSDSDTDTAVSSDRRFGFSTNRLKLQRIEEQNSDYEIVKRSFMNGMRDLGKNIDVVAIHRKNYDSGVMENARIEAFRVFCAAVASRNGGDPNIKYGWYGGSRDEIREILLYGFRRFDNRSLSYGRGVYLSPANIPIQSVLSSVADSDGLRHVLLCRVILGNPETVSFGSKKEQPSSKEFDSGVDDLSSPKKYVIWEPYMNSHILPVFLVSFQAESLTGLQPLRIPTSPHMSINWLMKHLKNYLSSSQMASIEKLRCDYRENKISRFGLIRSLRAIAGDDVLRAIVQGSK